ncbi:hypothetical protein SERLA73DRAFT_173664 [Serpula lacrymans var. lacrymans S7.3]|uniref:Uncharacterized protein n=2 Tax=Serpula lacrymans var. lacrymans TaxID=341189 RepID=F8PFB5_SERL3|nr:uncharacterized protein SERLADRAFT_454466 [Serpula lacrymans var. lacrymans S7.9]EGO04221.1 hypothetical protein SERLA73DRAFT_173664 [Serpula lacrymans var. lacrymans S7.3]EGO30160.1 hypothetical protein SERLADRAFT_454466 [Serpula lacrymans var. lacrymans S7.9]
MTLRNLKSLRRPLFSARHRDKKGTFRPVILPSTSVALLSCLLPNLLRFIHRSINSSCNHYTILLLRRLPSQLKPPLIRFLNCPTPVVQLA